MKTFKKPDLPPEDTRGREKLGCNASDRDEANSHCTIGEDRSETERRDSADPRVGLRSKSSFKASFPVLCGYIPVGMAFGFLFSQLGFPWYFASLMSLFCEAASAQFMALPLLEDHYSLTKLTLVILIINSRHMFYGLSLLKRYHTVWWKKFYLILGLTDETYSIVTGHPEEDANFCLKLTALNHLYWVLGTTLGALIGSAIQFHIPGIEFMLTALFVVLAIEQALRVKAAAPFMIALIWAVLAAKFVPGQMLIVAISLSALSLLVVQKVRARA